MRLSFDPWAVPSPHGRGGGWCVAISVLLAACATNSKAQADPNTLANDLFLPGLLDIPVPVSARVPEDCQLDTLGIKENLNTGCLAFSLDNAHVDESYLPALEEAGWRFSGGAANVFEFARSGTMPQCDHTLSVIGWLLGDSEEIAKYGRETEVTLDWSLITAQSRIFVVSPNSRCGEERR